MELFKMKKIGCYTMLFLFFLVSICAAETMYVVDIIKITLRTGPGTDHRVVKMLESGQKVEIIYQEEDWSQVRLEDGQKGWLLTRYISPEKPSSILLTGLQSEYDQLLQKAKTIREENLMLKKDNNTLSRELTASQKELKTVTDEYNTLKEESADFISLKSSYENTKNNLSEHEKKVAIMEKKLVNKNIILFLTGAVVLLIGFIIGFSSKKQRRRSLLS